MLDLPDLRPLTVALQQDVGAAVRGAELIRTGMLAQDQGGDEILERFVAKLLEISDAQSLHWLLGYGPLWRFQLVRSRASIGRLQMLW
jgi:hypothetical protein